MKVYRNERCSLCRFGKELGEGCDWLYQNDMILPPFLSIHEKGSSDTSSCYPRWFYYEEQARYGDRCRAFEPKNTK